MTFNADDFFSKPPVPIIPPSVEELVEGLEHCRRERSRPVILNLLRHYPIPPAVRRAVDRMKRCEISTWRRAGAYDRPYRRQCKHPLCPACSRRLARKEAERVWRMLNTVSQGALSYDDVSWVTVNIGCMPVGLDFRHIADRAKTAIRNMWRRKFPLTVWAMELEIELQVDETGKLHAHGLVWHPDVTRNEMREELCKLFTTYRAICVVPLKSRRLRHEAMRALTYKSDIDLSVSGWGQYTPEILSRLIQSYESMRSRGRFGLRFEMGLRRK
ncbi:hypothetical protein [Ferrovibrio sp.]|uniref:hypothetical protein n=1 Tax=Ferrovibrio sp. TaxID=1917215 RepID=UPI00261EECBA|nr:hypothetical protein [Ferrovibrio sp.]